MCKNWKVSRVAKFKDKKTENRQLRDVIDAGGNAVDAGVAVLLCMGVTIPESLGLGGGSLIVLYNRK